MQEGVTDTSGEGDDFRIMKRIKIALSVVAAALVVSLIGNIYLGASYAAQ